MSVSALPPTQRPIDRLGVVLSGLCAVHCLALPLVLALLGTGAAVTEAVHPVLAAALVPVTLRAMRGGAGLAWLAAGIGAVWLGLAGHLLGTDAAGTALTVVGSGLLTVGHRRGGCPS